MHECFHSTVIKYDTRLPKIKTDDQKRGNHGFRVYVLFSTAKPHVPNTPFTRESIHEANMKQTYSKYTCATCALSLLHRVNGV